MSLVVMNSASPGLLMHVSATDSGAMQVDEQLLVVNAGPSAVTVGPPRGQLDGLKLQGTGAQRQIGPGAAEMMDVVMTVDCSVYVEAPELAVEFAVRSPDGETREAAFPVTFAGSRLGDLAAGLCSRGDGPPSVVPTPNPGG